MNQIVRMYFTFQDGTFLQIIDIHKKRYDVTSTRGNVPFQCGSEHLNFVQQSTCLQHFHLTPILTKKYKKVFEIFQERKIMQFVQSVCKNEIRVILTGQAKISEDRIITTKEFQFSTLIIHDSNVQVSIPLCSQIHQLQDGKIYNLLEQDNDKRIITCGCVKSNCEAKYCQCFRWGETCSEKCACVGCKNKASRKQQPVETKNQGQGCNCVKSGCRKKYCECYQRGRKCDETCNCRGCLNRC